MWGYEHEGGLMGIGMILLWLIPIVLLVWLFARATTSKRGSNAPLSPREILDGRHARGEISHDEYLARRADLEK